MIEIKRGFLGDRMIKIKEVKIDGESIFVFNSAIYIFESSEGCTLELDLIVSEVAIRKYQKEETLIVEIELEDNRLISSIMHVKVVPGKLPIINLSYEIDNPDEFPDLLCVNEYDSNFPRIDERITIEEIRKIEMPNEKISLRLNLPIDQVEWLREQKGKDLNQIFKDLIYEYWVKQN
ncbi:hypothetical protein R4Z10_05745 [Niallia sp. XMNu-256]|uniref:hypothetical protein n=1 Tax=Niallia sp. XMNu-256 TaxID=3082444 RepID=UPI0030CCD6EA